LLVIAFVVPSWAGPPLIFSDGFETGDFSAWSSTFPPLTPPIANDDAETTFINFAVDVLVTLNDDGNGWLLTVSDLVIESGPSNGTAETGIGAILYTPNTDFEGTDTFVYSVSNATGLRDSATVTISVVPMPNQPPVANPDQTRTTPETAISIAVLSNDLDPDGSLDASSVVISSVPFDGTATPAADGSVTYTPDAGFEGVDTFEYTVADNQGAVSDPAVVTVTVGPFLGSETPPVDNISTAELEFLVRFGGQFVSRGVGLFLGFNHGSAESVANAEQVGDFSFLFPNNQSDRAVSEPYTFTTDLQIGTVTYNEAAQRYSVGGFVAAPIYDELDGEFTVSSDTDPLLTFSVDAPNTAVLDGAGQPAIVRGDFAQLATVVQYPDDDFTHFLVRFFTGIPGTAGTRIYLSRVPKEEMALDPNTGMRYREIVSEQVRNRLDELGENPVGDVAIVFYNQIDNAEIFPPPDRRPVPIAAGRGISLPGDQLVSRPTNRCENVPTNTLCEGGPNRRLLVTNRNGDVSIHDPQDGTFLARLIGDGSPNFVVDQGRQTLQDPATNCLLISDTRAFLPSGLRGGAIHLYDTNGTLIDDAFIHSDATTEGLARPRGMAIQAGELHVATENDGRVLRFDPSTGAFLGERLNDSSIAPRDVEHLASGELLVSNSAPSGTTDEVLLFTQDGPPTSRVLLQDLASPNQISLTNDLNFVVASFSTGQIRFFNDGAANLLSLGDRGTGISILDPTAPDPNNALVGEPLVSGSSWEFISEVCLPN
jgi:hypothetical protein